MTRSSSLSTILAAAAAAFAAAAFAQSEGGLYIAGDGFTFQQAATRAMAQNPGGQRFFLLSLPPDTNALTAGATGAAAKVRDRALAANGILFVCQRDIDSGKVNAANLVPGVVPVRGWPPNGSAELVNGRYFPGENPANLPASNEALRRLRSVCAY